MRYGEKEIEQFSKVIISRLHRIYSYHFNEISIKLILWLGIDSLRKYYNKPVICICWNF
jgi:hypothetical protein